MQTRRTFFVATSAVTLAAGTRGAANAGAANAGAANAGAAGPYDFPAIQSRLELPARHRQVFAARRLADGVIAEFMLNSLNAYEFDYAEGAGSLHALGVFYGTAVAMLLDSEVWRRYSIDVVQRRRGDPARPAASGSTGGNPYLPASSALDPAARRADLHGLYHDASLVALSKRGASFFACDNALRGLATDIAVTYGTSNVPAPTVHADLRQHLVATTLLVPAGVAAVNQAQEMKFTLLPASV